MLYRGRKPGEVTWVAQSHRDSVGLEPKSNREKHLQNRGVRMSKNHSFMKAGKTLANLSKSIFSELWKLIKDVQQSRGAFIQENGWSQKNRDLVAFSVAPFLSSPPRLCGNLESQQSQRPAKPGNLAAAAGAKPELELLQGPMLWELSPLSLFAPVSQKMAIIYHHNSPRWQ